MVLIKLGMINNNVNSTLIQKDIIIFSNYNVVVHLMFSFIPKLFFISVEEDSNTPEGMIWIGNNSGYYVSTYG